jgi:hypothetical protein
MAKADLIQQAKQLGLSVDDSMTVKQIQAALKSAPDQGEKKSSEPKNAGTHEAIQEFRDYADSVDGNGYATYKVGDDVSHLSHTKLKTLVEANLVKKSQPKQ